MNDRTLTAETAEQIIKDFCWLLSNIDGYMGYLNEQRSQHDLERNDLLHDIELSNFNACEGFFMTKKLKDCLLRRRYWKNEIELMRYVENFNNSHKGVKQLLQGVLHSMRQMQQNQEERLYVPRIREDLKCAEGA